jgi:His-Xaa-Ser system radical SAM maturase HxsB
MPLPVFRGPSDYAPSAGRYQLLPFRFMDMDGKQILVNESGEHEIVDRCLFDAFVSHSLPCDSETYYNLKAKHFLIESPGEVPLTLLAIKYRTKRSFLAGFTRLHIFVVTLRCDTSCQYCQVSRVSMDRSKYDMTRESADRALDLVFRSPAREIKIEFQGGEPLLNVDLIRYITLEAKRRNQPEGRDLQFVVTTNLSFISEEILTFLKNEGVWVSTSLDGPAFIHNVNRPRPTHDAYETTIRGIERVRAVLGHDAVSALMTTTRLSLQHPEAIVDEYVAREFGHIFLRPLSPYGFAVKTQKKTGYELQEFLAFYKRALNHIIELNRAGTPMVEIYAQILLTKILTPFPTRYVDLQSPAGAGIGVAVYNYDGDVYASDEARMLAEMGDKTFRLGNLHQNSYEEMFGGPLIRSLVAASCVESLPGCADCAFQTFCGADPIENHATQGDIFGHRPTSNFCGRNMEIIRHLLRLYHGGDRFINRLFWSWVQNVPSDVLVQAVPA